MTTARRFRDSVWNVALVAILTLTVGTDASAHRADEYLQAARIGIEPGLVDVYLDLTPGIMVAEPVIRLIDRDRDGRLSGEEQQSYARSVVSFLSLELDGEALPLRLEASDFPEPSTFLEGEGTLRLHLKASPRSVPAGPHALRFMNAYGYVDSVYLANALVPDSSRVQVVEQRRTRDQSELTIDYVLRPIPAGFTLGSIAVSLTATGLTVFFTRRRRN
jgi:hypothetical protein